MPNQREEYLPSLQTQAGVFYRWLASCSYTMHSYMYMQLIAAVTCG